MAIANSPIQMAAECLAKQHFKVEPGLEIIAWYTSTESSDAICFIEVNNDTFRSDAVEVFAFSPSPPEIPFPIKIADVTPAEWGKLQEKTIDLPQDWELRKVFKRGDFADV